MLNPRLLAQNVAYFADLADSIIIILKDSLKWIPFVGWVSATSSNRGRPES